MKQEKQCNSHEQSQHPRSLFEVYYWHLQCHSHFSYVSEHCHSDHTALESAASE